MEYVTRWYYGTLTADDAKIDRVKRWEGEMVMSVEDVEKGFINLMSGCSDMLHPLDDEKMKRYVRTNVRNPETADAIEGALVQLPNLSDHTKDKIRAEVKKRMSDFGFKY